MIAALDKERAQGMPGAGRTHGPPAAKKQAAVTTGSAEAPGIPRAMVLRLIRDLPGAPGFLATMTRMMLTHQREDTSVGVSGPHDFVVRAGADHPHAFACASPSRPPHPALHVP